MYTQQTIKLNNFNDQLFMQLNAHIETMISFIRFRFNSFISFHSIYTIHTVIICQILYITGGLYEYNNYLC